MSANDGFEAVRVEVLLGVGAYVDLDLRAAVRLVLRRRDRVAAVPGGLPDNRFVLAGGRPRRHHHPLSHHEHGVETDAELADQPDPALFVLLLRQLLQEFLRPGVGDGADVVIHLVPRHADAGVANRQRLGIRVDADVDLKLGVEIDDVPIGERPEANLVEGVRRVRHEFAQEHVLVGVERMDEDLQDLLNLGLEGSLLHLGFLGGRGVMLVCHGLFECWVCEMGARNLLSGCNFGNSEMYEGVACPQDRVWPGKTTSPTF